MAAYAATHRVSRDAVHGRAGLRWRGHPPRRGVRIVEVGHRAHSRAEGSSQSLSSE
jgi:hypothetical protein